jgi:stringent starvation protein B
LLATRNVTAASPPKRPYLLRALHEWMVDSGQTPHLVVDAAAAGADLPAEHVEDGRIVLNVSYSATNNLVLGNDEIVFDARFGGAPRRIRVPLRAVLGIYARETREGLVFAPDEYGSAGTVSSPDPDETPPPSGRPALKIVK